MYHAFNIEVAAECGTAAALLLQNIFFWVEKNAGDKSEKHFKEGKYWTYNTVNDLHNIFPYLKKCTIRKGIRRLQDAGFIKTGNYNKLGMDRTIWYTVTDKAVEVLSKEDENGENTTIFKKLKMQFQKSENAFSKNEKCNCKKLKMQFQKNENAFSKNCTPIPDITPYINTDITSDINADTKSKKKIPASKLPPDYNDDPENKRPFAEFVFLTDKEHESLLKQYGPEMTAELIDILSNYKKQQQRGYYSDVGAIRNWCVDKYKKRHQYDKPKVKDAVTEAIEILERGAVND